MMRILCTLSLPLLVYCRFSQAFVSSSTSSFLSQTCTSRRHAATRPSPSPRLSMMFGRRGPAPQLSEEELASMDESREEMNQKLRVFLESQRAEKEARRNAAQAEQREKVAKRMKAEKEDAEHKKVYIPQRLEEIEKEEAMLRDKMSAFNTKIKDKEINEL